MTRRARRCGFCGLLGPALLETLKDEYCLTLLLSRELLLPGFASVVPIRWSNSAADFSVRKSAQTVARLLAFQFPFDSNFFYRSTGRLVSPKC
jgi:hypothetical protein